MKKLIVFLIIIISSKSICIAQQDSARTINDKPGTPQSLRTPYNGPTNRVHVINPSLPQNQTINHQGVESANVNNVKQPKIMPYTNYTPAPVQPNTNTNLPKANTTPASPDSITNNKPPNVSDPTHR